MEQSCSSTHPAGAAALHTVSNLNIPDVPKVQGTGHYAHVVTYEFHVLR